MPPDHPGAAGVPQWYGMCGFWPLRSTAKQGAVFALLTAWPAVDATTNTTVIELIDPTIPASVTARAALLGREDLQLTAAALGDSGGVRIEFPPALGPESLPCDSAWVIKLTGVE